MANFDPLLDAWQARQRPRSQQQQQQQQQFAYDLNNVNIPGLLSSPPSTSSSLSSASSSAIPLASWTPSSWSEAEMLRRGLLSDRSVDMLSAFGSDHHPHHHQFNGELGVQLKHQHQQQLFDFNFSLPINLGLSLDNTENENNNTQLYQQDPLRCSPALLTPTSSYSSSSSNCSPPTPPSPIYSQHLKHLQMFSSPTSSTKRSIFDSESVSPAPSSHSVDSSDISGAASEHAKISNNLGGSTNAAKRQRACMSTKDFVPPDVTGLSKREARLVKNRAAAFLSRQRKREEFEQMEMCVIFPAVLFSVVLLNQVLFSFFFFTLEDGSLNWNKKTLSSGHWPSRSLQTARVLSLLLLLLPVVIRRRISRLLPWAYPQSKNPSRNNQKLLFFALSSQHPAHVKLTYLDNWK